MPEFLRLLASYLQSCCPDAKYLLCRWDLEKAEWVCQFTENGTIRQLTQTDLQEWESIECDRGKDQDWGG